MEIDEQQKVSNNKEDDNINNEMLGLQDKPKLNNNRGAMSHCEDQFTQPGGRQGQG